MLKVTSLSGETQKRERLAGGFLRNNLSNNEKANEHPGFGCSFVYVAHKRNALVQCV